MSRALCSARILALRAAVSAAVGLASLGAAAALAAPKAAPPGYFAPRVWQAIQREAQARADFGNAISVLGAGRKAPTPPALPGQAPAASETPPRTPQFYDYYYIYSGDSTNVINARDAETTPF
jgi:hypothetical protein